MQNSEKRHKETENIWPLNCDFNPQESSRLDPDTQFSYIRVVVSNGLFDKRSEIDKWWLCSKRPSLCYKRSN